MEDIKRIVFVCTGNTCRSPMALAVAKREIKRLGVSLELFSVGIRATPGNRATDNAVAVCREIGLDISEHVAQRLDDAKPDQHTLYVVLDHQHLSWLRYVLMLPHDQIYLLGEGVEDPYGRDLDHYRKALAVIEHDVVKLMERLAPDLPKADENDANAERPLNYFIYPMTDDCVAEVSLLENRSFPDPWSLAMLSEELDNPDAVLLVAIGDDAESGQNAIVYGYGCIIVAADVALMPKLCVLDSARRHGIATALVNALADEARQRGAQELTLEARVSNRGAIALYDKLGFTSMGIRPNFYDHPKEDAMIMTMQLNPTEDSAADADAEDSAAEAPSADIAEAAEVQTETEQTVEPEIEFVEEAEAETEPETQPAPEAVPDDIPAPAEEAADFPEEEEDSGMIIIFDDGQDEE